MTPDASITETATVLLVEDDDVLRREMAAYLGAQGYAVRQAGAVEAAREILETHAVDVVVLDVNLPGEDGLSLCRQLARPDGPAILMLSAMGEAVDRILGLELGADDYVVKPIPPRELLARVKALMRRRAAGGPQGRNPKRNTYAFAGFRLDLSARQLTAPGGMLLLLTRGELAILSLLLDNARSVVSREDLLTVIRGEAAETVGRGVDLHISRLRRKIEAQSDQELIKTYRGVGYVLDAKVVIE
ncbi:response regulator [Caulobacter endophyticus]|uniref:response regulator n=1 Tax=Caulobacter endophyticus TaxID=2172652 RepID=UPI00240FC1C1|nr:response regulator transcription factor [Caulobacter endophyticus]MDG2529020.1 response regulator transcription factor [Caulobacter endophyticus]